MTDSRQSTGLSKRIGCGLGCGLLLLNRAMGALDLPVQLWGAEFDVDVLDALVRDVPMKQRLERMAAVGAHRVNAEGKRPDHVV